MPVSRDQRRKHRARFPGEEKKDAPLPKSDPISPPARPVSSSSARRFDVLGKRLRSGFPLFLTWAATVLSIFAGAVVFLPRITVEPSAPYDPASPAPITFTIANANIVALREVVASVGLCEAILPERWTGGRSVILKGAGQCSTSATMTRLTNDGWHIKWLDADERWQIALEEQIKGSARDQVENANITIVVEYTPWHLPSFLRREKQFRFVTKKRSDGKIYWAPTPLNP